MAMAVVLFPISNDVPMLQPGGGIDALARLGVTSPSRSFVTTRRRGSCSRAGHSTTARARGGQRSHRHV